MTTHRTPASNNNSKNNNKPVHPPSPSNAHPPIRYARLAPSDCPGAPYRRSPLPLLPLCVQMARTRNPSRRFGKKIKKTTRAPPRSRVATVPTTTAVKMVKKWEREHGACARMIKVDRDDDQKKVCYDEKRHYNQDAIDSDRGNPKGNYISIYLRHMQSGNNRIVCFDFDERDHTDPPPRFNPLFQKFQADGCLLGETLSGCE
jgi:hypothetical protein